MPILHPLLASASSAADPAPASSNLIVWLTVLVIVLVAGLFILGKKLAAMNRRLTEVEIKGTVPPFAHNGTTDSSSPSTETVAAITAAVHTTIRSRMRILAIGEPCPHRQAWSVEGRRQVFQSHKVR